jgi:serine/threonine protein kinase
MSPERYQQVSAAFNAALKAPVEGRDALIREACGNDDAMRAEVERMLENHARATQEQFLDAPDLTGPFAPAPAEAVGTRIGPYKILQRIGEGGFGVVYMAEQEHQIRRRVALKVIKPGMDSAQVVARFEAERQALAMMDHPNIARVFDAGTTDAGRPYFVMELVHGVPVTAYCYEAVLPLRERLALFVAICQAVQHAHQKGVIHRDLKPSNVLVTMLDGRPVPKVIDFGIAKAIGQQLTEKTIFTQFGAAVGTFEYMSPEQAGMSALDVDTRSDIYSLGVLLYELLTGTTPLGRDGLRQAAYDEIVRRIKQEEPPSPSLRLSGPGDRLKTIAASRGIEPEQLKRSVRGDLDWVVMKALEKDRNRRYETANGFARDVQRYLDGDPVEAGRPSAWYRVRKLATKHRTALAGAGAFAVLLTVATAVSAGLAVWADGQRRRAEDAERKSAERLVQVEAERRRAVAAEGQAKDRLTQVEKANTLLGSIFRNLDPRSEQKEGKPLRAILSDRLGKAADDLDGSSIGDALTVARLQTVLGTSLIGLGESRRAIVLLERARETRESKLGPDQPDTIQSSNNLANAYLNAGRTAEAIKLHQATLKIRESKLGPDDPQTLQSINNLAIAYQAAGRTAEAIKLHQATLRSRESKLGPDHPDTLATRNNLANAYQVAGRTAEAIKLYEPTLRDRESKLGPDDLVTLSLRNNLALAYQAVGRTAEAITLDEATLKIRESKLGPDHPDTLATRNNLASAYQAAGRIDEAIKLYEETLKLRESKLGPDHPDTLATRNNLANSYKDAGLYEDAIRMHEATLKMCISKLGPDHRDTLSSRSNLATAYLVAGRTAQAIKLYEATLELREPNLGPDDPITLFTRDRLTLAYQAAGLYEDAIKLHKAALKHYEAKLRPDHPTTFNSRINLALAYEGLGRWVEAEPLRRDALAVHRRTLKPDSPLLAGDLAPLGRNLLKQSKWPEAERLLRESLAIREKVIPGEWQRFNSMAMLGGALLGQGRYAEAEPLIVGGYNGMAVRSAKIGAGGRFNLSEAAERVIRLYEAWGKPEKVREWRSKLGLADLPADVFARP